MIEITHKIARTQFNARYIGQTIDFLCSILAAHCHRLAVIDGNNATAQFLTIAQIDHIGIKALRRSRESKTAKQNKQEENLFHCNYKLDRYSK